MSQDDFESSLTCMTLKDFCTKIRDFSKQFDVSKKLKQLKMKSYFDFNSFSFF